MKLVVSHDKGLFYDLVRPYVNFMDHLRYDTHSGVVTVWLDECYGECEWKRNNLRKHNN